MTGPGADRAAADAGPSALTADVAVVGAGPSALTADVAVVGAGPTALTADVAVVGAGPAGLTAAVTAAEAGCRVVLVDAAPQPGGQFWRHPAEPPHPAELGDPDRLPHPGELGDLDRLGDPDRLPRGYADLRARLDAARARGTLTYLPGTQVWFVQRTPTGTTLHLTPAPGAPTPALGSGALGSGARVAGARAVVLCPGGHDRQVPVPGWELPGVLTAGGVQALLKGHGVLAGRRAVVAGTGPFLLPVATALARAGARVLAVCDANHPARWLRHPGAALAAPGKLAEAAGYAAALLRHRVRYRARTVVSAIHGDDEVTAATLSTVDSQGRVRAEVARLEVDLVALGWGFTPAVELATAAGADTRLDLDGALVARVDDGQRAAPGVYLAGEVTGVGGAALAAAEGELAALTAAADLGRAVPDHRVRRARRAVRAGRRFAAALHRAHPVPRAWPDWVTPDTVVCRCEEVTRGELRHACDELGATDPRTAKLLTRAGMGWCQGRICGDATAALTHPEGRPDAADRRALAGQPLCAPVTLGELADPGAEPAGSM